MNDVDRSALESLGSERKKEFQPPSVLAAVESDIVAGDVRTIVSFLMKLKKAFTTSK